MCGIAGWFGPTGRDTGAEATLRAMLDVIAHRGPDGGGMAHRGPAALGHRRLAVIAPDASGAQPMSTRDGAVTVVTNGEVYNFRALRAELAARGFEFDTHSDTEVLLALYRRHGIEGLARVRGMFALALWDEDRGLGYLARDRFGIKPLYYHETSAGGVVFASEAKAVLLGPDSPRARLDARRLHLLMNFRYVPGGDGLFADIEQVRPGEVVEWSRDRPLRRHGLAASAHETSDATLDARLADSVTHHLEADVPVAVYLSGGIDSAAILAHASRTPGGAPPTHTLALGDDPQEADNAARTAELLGAANHRHEPRAVDREFLDDLIWHLEMPKVNAFQGMMLARAAGETHKVCLSGLGADELFLGYRAHRILRLFARGARILPAPLARLTACTLGLVWDRTPGAPWRESRRAIDMLGRQGDWPAVYGVLRNVWDTPGMRRAIYGPRLLDEAPEDAFEHLRARWPRAGSPLRAMRQFEWGNKMVDDLLLTEDRCSMAAGVEVRVPFVDPALHEHAFNPCRSRRIETGPAKALLHAALAGTVPEEVLRRPKSGFQIDAPRFFHRHLAEPARELLAPQTVRDHGLFNPDFVTRVLALPPGKGLRWHYFILILMLMTHAWLERFEGARAGAVHPWSQTR